LDFPSPGARTFLSAAKDKDPGNILQKRTKVTKGLRDLEVESGDWRREAGGAEDLMSLGKSERGASPARSNTRPRCCSRISSRLQPHASGLCSPRSRRRLSGLALGLSPSLPLLPSAKSFFPGLCPLPLPPHSFPSVSLFSLWMLGASLDIGYWMLVLGCSLSLSLPIPGLRVHEASLLRHERRNASEPTLLLLYSQAGNPHFQFVNELTHNRRTTPPLLGERAGVRGTATPGISIFAHGISLWRLDVGAWMVPRAPGIPREFVSVIDRIFTT
jgi:hypothetical protein